MFAITISIGFVQFPSWFGNFEGRPQHHGIPQHHVALVATAPGSLDKSFEVWETREIQVSHGLI